MENKYGANVISKHEYTYDGAGRRATAELSGTEFEKAINAKAARPWFQNAQVTSNALELAPDARGYAYDPIGNRKTATGWDQSAQVQTSTTYTPNALNQYATINAASLAFDLDGNLSEDAARIYTYDGENRLVSVEPKAPAEGDRKATFAYDYMGRRVKKETHAWQTSAWVKTDETRYLYDGWNMIRELNASGQTRKSYVWGIDLSGTLQGAGGIGGLVASVEPSTGTHAHYFFDGNGNVTQAVDAATGAPLAHYEYDPFGNVTFSGGPMAASNPYRFSTKYHDDETTLVYYGYRFYSPALGRWLNRDPIEEKGGINLYSFVENKTIGLIDPLGLMSCCSINDETGKYNTQDCFDDNHARDGVLFYTADDGTCGYLDYYDDGKTYCGYYNRQISYLADTTQIAASVAAIISGGSSTPISVTVYGMASWVSFGNSVITIVACGPSAIGLSTLTSTVGLKTPPGWWGAIISTLDMYFTYNGY